jgi:Ca2+-binding RTX toxin-like protein
VSGRRIVLLLALAGAVVLVAASLTSALTAANTVPATNAGLQSFAITAQDLAPPQCAGMSLTATVTNLNGGSANELVLGTAATDTLNGGAGNDCLIGGGGIDICIGGLGTDVFVSCETPIQ